MSSTIKQQAGLVLLFCLSILRLLPTFPKQFWEPDSGFSWVWQEVVITWQNLCWMWKFPLRNQWYLKWLLHFSSCPNVNNSFCLLFDGTLVREGLQKTKDLHSICRYQTIFSWDCFVSYQCLTWFVKLEKVAWCNCTFPVESLTQERSRSARWSRRGRQVCWKSPNWLVWGRP